MYGQSIPPEFAHLWDAETGRWKEGSLVKMLEILAPNSIPERIKAALVQREPGEEG